MITLISIVCVSCSSIEAAPPSASTPSFVTATLPSTFAPAPSHTALPPSLVPTSNPIQGNTTTQVNIRAETNTASETLGVIPAFSNIQIIGKESTGNWYQIIYESGIGWVRSEFVQVDASAEINVVGIESSSPIGMSGVVKSGINVRSGAGKDFESIGVLTQNDVVWITAKDESNAWAQIEFIGKVGWVALEFLQIETIENLPVISIEIPLELTPLVITELPTASTQIAFQDGDSIQTPFAKTFFTEGKTLQVTNQVSAPQGDNEDWMEFSAFTPKIIIETSCSDAGLQLELWQSGVAVEQFSTPCEDIYFLSVLANESYTLRIFQESGYTSYRLKIKTN